MAQQRLGQQQVERVEHQLLAPERCILVVLAEDGAAEVDHVAVAHDGRRGWLAARRRLAMGAEVLPRAVKDRGHDLCQHLGPRIGIDAMPRMYMTCSTPGKPLPTISPGSRYSA
jgi:hypothetical protein